ncbi:hypothetical protein TRSC58_03834 [Trypanosoma rangeli SC58]|uniref:Ubiquitin thioesterase OTU n=1 Tax=Trypanosoma rangeli SC58 TaxID=429131 RepID=A0A061IZ83_TRYRA|nr:hypothetical protein TRSC58_03834 [Trypanosoma rangeli SC58]
MLLLFSTFFFLFFYTLLLLPRFDYCFPSPSPLYIVEQLVHRVFFKMKFRLRLPNSSEPVPFEAEESVPWVVFLHGVEDRSGIVKERLRILAGYPPRVVEAADTDLVGSRLRHGDTLIVQEGEATVVRGVTNGRYVPPASDRWHFVRRICPSDNSCLFHAAAYVLRDKSRTDGPKLRDECANAVLADPGYFTELLLEKPNHEYAEWIRRPTSWGGAIELMILSFTEQTEIVTLDLESTRMERFGQGMGYTVRAFVVYTGRHYDAIAMNPSYNSPRESEDQVLFNLRDESVVSRAERFVLEESERMKR